MCCGWAARGLGMGDGRLYVGQLDSQVVALDQRTGKVLWRTQSQTLADGGYSITMAPLYYDGMVIIGHSGGEKGIRGVIKAFDAATGELRWKWYTIPAPGEPGSETWPKDSDAWKYGGGAVWSTPAMDPELGLIYFPVANPAPDLNGHVREGDNLFTLFHRGAGREDRHLPLALPGRAPRHLGLRRREPGDPVRCEHRTASRARASRMRRSPATCTSSIASPASRWWASRSGPCRRTLRSRPRPRSRFR